jgi:cytochrome c-type biogenesis protein
VGQLLREHLTLLSQIAGVAIILMGVHFLGLFRLALLSRDTRYSHTSRPAGLLGAYVIGLAFAFGWTPCIGPVLAVILAVAASEESVAQGAFLLAVYSAGLGVPFMAAAIGIEEFLAFLSRFRAHFRLMERGMGALLVLTGIMFLTGFMQTMSYWLLETFPALGRLG